MLRGPFGLRAGQSGQIAQLVEHGIENAGVAGSSPALPTSADGAEERDERRRREGPTAQKAGLPTGESRLSCFCGSLRSVPRPGAADPPPDPGLLRAAFARPTRRLIGRTTGPEVPALRPSTGRRCSEHRPTRGTDGRCTLPEAGDRPVGRDARPGGAARFFSGRREPGRAPPGPHEQGQEWGDRTHDPRRHAGRAGGVSRGMPAAPAIGAAGDGRNGGIGTDGLGRGRGEPGARRGASDGRRQNRAVIERPGG